MKLKMADKNGEEDCGLDQNNVQLDKEMEGKKELTDRQKARIEKNRQRAILLRQAR